jgi:hypothetical protein
MVRREMIRPEIRAGVSGSSQSGMKKHMDLRACHYYLIPCYMNILVAGIGMWSEKFLIESKYLFRNRI